MKDKEMKEYKPEYWENMSQILDREMPVSFFQKPVMKYGTITFFSAAAVVLGLVMISETNDEVQPEATVPAVVHTIESQEPQTTAAIEVPEFTPVYTAKGKDKVSSALAEQSDMVETNITGNEIQQSSPALTETGDNDASGMLPAEEITRIISQISEQEVITETQATRKYEPQKAIQTGVENPFINSSAVPEKTIPDSIPIRPSTINDEVGSTANDANLVMELPVEKKGSEVSRLFILGGVNLTKGFTNSYEPSEIVFNPLLGLGYSLPLSTKWSVSMSAIWMQRGGSNLVQESNNIVYFLEKEITSYKVNTYKINYLHIPLKVGYELGKGHKALAGAYLSYVLDARSTVVTSQSTLFKSKVLNESKSGGYLEGLNRFVFGLSLEYQYAISPKFNIGLILNQGLNDATKNEVYKSSSTDLATDLQLIIRYNILK